MRVLVAMSGGVDSSVVAGLMVEAGHEVVGATLQLYDHGAATAARRGACCAGDDIHDARRVADRLGIAHYVLDREARFRAAVIDDFAAAYARGETPVPCVRCNQTVKFADLTSLARDLGCDALATGHYARRVDGPDGPELRRAADPARDQSWFLHATTRDQLGFARFPLGDMPDKGFVRAIAERLGLAVADKPDSQDICFVPAGRYDALVTRLHPDAGVPGEIVDSGSGAVLGRHDGIARYTVGQARGIPAVAGARRYVAAIDATRRRLLVAPAGRVAREVIGVHAVNWLVPPPVAPLRCRAKFRAREQPMPVTVGWDNARDILTVRPDVPAVAAPGQACVLYDGDRVLGGGTIGAGVDLGAVAA